MRFREQDPDLGESRGSPDVVGPLTGFRSSLLRSVFRPVDQLTASQWFILGIVTAAAAVSRWFAVTRSPWDWDEILFALGLRDYNVALHHPHPPGFPLYIGTAKVLMILGLDDFHALQMTNIVAAVAIVPVMFFLCRELRLRFSTSISAASLLAFFPNVWFYGGTAFSDVSSMTLVVLSLALLLRGCRGSHSYLLGVLVLAVAAGYRPQNLLIGAPMFLLSSTCAARRTLRLIAAALILIVVAGGGYAAAAGLTGWTAYGGALKTHQQYIASVDSFRSPTRPPLWRIFDDFFIHPYRAPAINIVVSLLAAVSVVSALARTRFHIVMALAAFGPFCLFAWLTLDHFSASRFSIGYAPFIAILAADGLSILARRPMIEELLLGAIVFIMVSWTWPALREVHATLAPPIAAIEWIRTHINRSTSAIYVQSDMKPYAERYLADYRVSETEDAPLLALQTLRPGVFLKEGASNTRQSQNFTRPRRRLDRLARQRYFEVSVQPITEVVQFGDGWYEQEGGDGSVWRWMRHRAVVFLPPIAGHAVLTLSLYVPLDVLRVPPMVNVRLNGATIDHFLANRSDIVREYTVYARPDRVNELTLETDRVVNPAAQRAGSDPRDLGLRLNMLGWTPAPHNDPKYNALAPPVLH
jgi:hypothetical protein